jgi:hypothetical protein
MYPAKTGKLGSFAENLNAGQKNTRTNAGASPIGSQPKGREVRGILQQVQALGALGKKAQCVGVSSPVNCQWHSS